MSAERRSRPVGDSDAARLALSSRRCPAPATVRHRSNRIYDADLARSYLAPADAKVAGYVSLTTGSIRRRSAERDYRARSPMMSREQIRRLALALPEVVEQDHHGRPSFRVAGRIFATLWDEGHMNVMLDQPGIPRSRAPRSRARSSGGASGFGRCRWTSRSLRRRWLPSCSQTPGSRRPQGG